MKPLSFRLKIALFSALISGVVLVGMGAASLYLLCQQKVAAMDTEIRSLGTRHPGWLAGRQNFERLNSALEFIFGEEHKGNMILLVKDAEGKTLYTSPGWPKALAPESVNCSLADDPSLTAVALTNREATSGWGGQGGAGLGRGWGGMGRGFGPGRGGNAVVFTKIPRFFTAKTADSAWRIGLMGNNDLRLAVGLNYETISAELSRTARTYLLILPVALLLVGAGGWLVAGRALRPLRNISRLAQQVTARGLDQRIPASREDPEISRLIEVLNAMMDRLQASFSQAVRFSADASHELKTPLAIMQGELENALQTAAPGSAEERVFLNLLEEAQRLKVITRGLLLLSRADVGQLKLALEPVNLSAELEAVIEDARILAAHSVLTFDADVPPDLWVEADLGLLQMALFNLLSNAVKYNQPGGRVRVTLAAQGDNANLTVSNTGPGIPATQQAKIFDRFYRGDQTRGRAVDGLGLGLSLAREIVRAHQGELALKGSDSNETCFVLSLRRLRDAPRQHSTLAANRQEDAAPAPESAC
jgi:two-component system, OmpR family, heavy metal sensor histidine kinase CusS